MRLKVLQALIDYCDKKNSTELHKHLMGQLDEEKPNVKVYKDCLRDFTNALCKPDLPMGVNNEGESSKSTLTFRSAGIECFDWKSNCFLGGKRLTVDKKHLGRNTKYLKLEKLNPWIL